MIRLATGITPNYLQRALPFIDSLYRHCNISVTIFTVNFGAHAALIYPLRPTTVPVDYSKAAIQLPKWMLQHGGFCQFAPPDWADDDVIIFTDADAVLQRPFTDAELATFSSVGVSEFLAGYNRANGRQTLADEAPRIFPKVPMDRIAQRFPLMAEMDCRNWGFVVARMSAWRQLLARTIALEPDCAACFDNPARVQFMCCYAAQSGMVLTDLSPVTHAHGHVGLRVGLVKGEDGLWRQDGEIVAFAHAL